MSARADSALLSGYGGPGSSEQTIIGPSAPAAGQGSSGASAGATVAPGAASASLEQGTATAVAQAKHHSTTPGGSGSGTPVADEHGSTHPAITTSAAPATTATGTGVAGSSAGMPLSSHQLLLALLGLLGLVAIAYATGRLVRAAKPADSPIE